ncbi:MAG TPA: peptidase S8, partial [Bacteroidetes bacterium]|nr:peptidase S8 [Bacteroidota bacterium]
SVVKLNIFDVAGREVAKLVDNELTPGVYEYAFNGSGLSSGVYFYRLETGFFTETKRMVLVK